jgi:hypothetical protein
MQKPPGVNSQLLRLECPRTAVSPWQGLFFFSGLPGNDPYYLAVCRAYDSVQALCVATHYLTCNGVGRPDRPE